MTNDQELLGIHEIATLAKVSPAAVANWRVRYHDFPQPFVELRSGPVFRRDLILAWLRRRKISMTTVISTINLKGGVAKTTTTVALAQMLDAEFHKRVLVVDLDPQTNATVMLIGDERWKALDEEQQTVAQLFRDALNGDQKVFDLQKSIQTRVGSVTDVRHVSLLPSSLDLIDVQENLSSMNPGRFHATNPTDVLRRALKPVLDAGKYDFVLIDCPPSLGLVTLNGLRISNYYIIPTIPDFLSTYGIPQIVRRIAEFSDVIGIPIEPLGIVATKFRRQSPVHLNQLKILKQERDAPLFKTVIPENSEISGAAEYKAFSTLRQKWGYHGQFDIYRALTKEILERIDVAVA